MGLRWTVYGDSRFLSGKGAIYQGREYMKSSGFGGRIQLWFDYGYVENEYEMGVSKVINI